LLQAISISVLLIIYLGWPCHTGDDIVYHYDEGANRGDRKLGSYSRQPIAGVFNIQQRPQ